jgi:hypothetical protein
MGGEDPHSETQTVITLLELAPGIGLIPNPAWACASNPLGGRKRLHRPTLAEVKRSGLVTTGPAFSNMAMIFSDSSVYVSLLPHFHCSRSQFLFSTDVRGGSVDGASRYGRLGRSDGPLLVPSGTGYRQELGD